MWEQIPSIIEEAAKSQLGIWALAITAMSLIGFVFFRRAEARVKVGVYIFMFAGIGLFAIAASTVDPSQSVSQPATQPDEPELLLEAALLLSRADRFRFSGDNDKARDAYVRAASLYKTVEDLQGEADVLSDLGDLEYQLGHFDKARQAYTEARILFEAVGDRRSEVDVQLNLEELEYQLARNDKDRERSASGMARDRVELIAHVAGISGLTLQVAERAVNAMLDGIAKTLANGDEVRFVGFGTFSVSHRKATQGRNPRTGAAILIPAANIPKFKAGKALKEAVNLRN